MIVLRSIVFIFVLRLITFIFIIKVVENYNKSSPQISFFMHWSVFEIKGADYMIHKEYL